MMSNNRASNEFWEAFSDGATLVAGCSCGRTVFSSRATGDYEEGELEKLLYCQQKEPDRYISDPDNDGIGILEIGGQIFAFNCKCNGAARYENFIWSNRENILKYLRLRVAEEKARADSDAQLLSEVG